MNQLSDVSRQHPTVRISIPVSIAANLGSFYKAIDLIVDRLGCASCFSGADCSFQLQRDLVVNERLEINAVEARLSELGAANLQGGLMIDTVPVPDKPAITMPAAVSYNLELVHELVKRVAGMNGCPECHSGLDILYRNERELFMNEQFQIFGR